MSSTSHSTKKGIVSTPVLLFLLLSVHFIGSYLALSFDLDRADFFSRIRIDGTEFFTQFITTGFFLYALALAASLLLFKIQNFEKAGLAIFCLSLVAATLMAQDKFDFANRPAAPDTFSGMFYLLLTGRQPVLLLSILTLLGAIALIYYVIRTFFKVSFEGAGIQIKLPGQTMYYMAVFPQTPWQRTGIELKEGDEITVELSGLVSPGGLQNFWYLREDLDKFHALQEKAEWSDEKEKRSKEWRKILDEKSWPYSGPEGYEEKLYFEGSSLGVLKNHPIYGKGNGLNDDCMTVKGKPHNTVFGIIQNGNEEPKDTTKTIPAYDWETDRDKLIELSDKKYPKSITVKQTGELWVVINDVDYARWDNTGMFFLRLTKHS